MPLYDFKCETCERVEEMLLPSAGSYDTKLTCPDCETETMKRQVSLSSFKLEGGGWYKDGYGTKKPESKPSPPKTSDGVTKAKPIKDE